MLVDPKTHCNSQPSSSAAAQHALSGYFLTKIFHPNVAKNGEICVNTLKRDWKREYGIAHILLVRPTQFNRP